MDPYQRQGDCSSFEGDWMTLNSVTMNVSQQTNKCFPAKRYVVI